MSSFWFNGIFKAMATSKITPQMIRKISQLSDETIVPKAETLPNEGVSFEQNIPDGEEKVINQQAINQLKVQKETWARKRIKEIEDEVHILTQKRQEEMRKRYEQKIPEQKQKEAGQQETQKTQPLEISSKPQKGKPMPTGRQAFWGKRIKTAQQQAQPETAGRRIGG